MNGLKMMWIISRNYKSNDKMQDLISLITDEIADKVESSINISKLFDLGENPEQQLNHAKALMAQGKKILEEWDKEYNKAKASIEEEQL